MSSTKKQIVPVTSVSTKHKQTTVTVSASCAAQYPKNFTATSTYYASPKTYPHGPEKPAKTITITAPALSRYSDVSIITKSSIITITASAPPHYQNAKTITKSFRVTRTVSTEAHKTVTATFTKSAKCSESWPEHSPSSYHGHGDKD
ncbi:hypothetical protein Slin14017_G077480 [Septoria linicola]|nr:hypothetical protein Slin14017_G077480 [Septoria linicola]